MLFPRSLEAIEEREMTIPFERYPQVTALIRFVQGDGVGVVMPLDEFIAKNDFKADYAMQLRDAIKLRGEFTERREGKHIWSVRFVGLIGPQ